MRRTLLAIAFILAVPAPLQARWQDSTLSASHREEIAKGRQLALDGRYREALQVFERLLLDDSSNPLFNYYVGMCHLNMDSVDKAILFLETAVERKAKFPQAYQWAARAYLRKGKRDLARKAVALGLGRFARNRPLLELEASLKADPRS